MKGPSIDEMKPNISGDKNEPRKKIKIAKPSEIPELQIRNVDEIELDLSRNFGAFVSKICRELYYLRRDYDHLHAVVEKILGGEIT